jgi:hypothetical protein
MIILAWAIIVLFSSGLLFLLCTTLRNSPDVFLAFLFGPAIAIVIGAFMWAIATVAK